MFDGLVAVTAGMPFTFEVFSSQARREGTIAENQSEWSKANEHEKSHWLETLLSRLDELARLWRIGRSALEILRCLFPDGQ